MTRAKHRPGSERYRDERRDVGGARMHGRLWHDHDAPRTFEREYLAAAEAVPEAEGGEEHLGMGKHVGRGHKGSGRLESASPRGKGKRGIQSAPGPKRR